MIQSGINATEIAVNKLIVNKNPHKILQYLLLKTQG